MHACEFAVDPVLCADVSGWVAQVQILVIIDTKITLHSLIVTRTVLLPPHVTVNFSVCHQNTKQANVNNKPGYVNATLPCIHLQVSDKSCILL